MERYTDDLRLVARMAAQDRGLYLHIGLPKTGTTYLQTILWQNRAALSAQAVLVPGP